MIFDHCLIEAIGDIYETPIDFFRPGAAGPKFSLRQEYSNHNNSLYTETVTKALVVEYNSNVMFTLSHEAMREFYLKVNYSVINIFI